LPPWVAQSLHPLFPRSPSLERKRRRNRNRQCQKSIHSCKNSALAYEALGQREQALALLQNAVRIAEPDGWIRLFADEGAAMANLLNEVPGLPATHRAELISAASGSALSTPAGVDLRETSLLEPLSVRELEVLGLIAAGRSTSEIAQKLIVANSTVKTHTNNIFGKLGVNRGTLAVARARDLGLLS
jgi:LuxR family maltose regulon positive regulatory protein